MNRSYMLVIMMGFISLFADIASNGAQAITGPYMQMLGASGFVVSFVAGFGELLGYGLRVFSGRLVDKTRQYWAFTTAGYAVTLVSMPLIGLAGSWPLVAALIFSGRVGKALRAPARDTIISYGAKQVGTGMGYGIHQAMDFIGSLTGPILVSALLYYQVGYRLAFGVLVIPAVVALSLLLAAQRNFPNPEKLEPKDDDNGDTDISRPLWVYIVAVSLVGMGFSDFPLIAFHVKKNMIMADSDIPLLFSLAMLVGAVSALTLGRLFDRIGIYAVAIGVAFSTMFSYFAYLGGATGVVVGVVLWGVGVGVQESIMRASIANLIHSSVRGKVFGIFNGCYGLFSFIGSAIMGYLYDQSVVYLVYFSIALHIAAFAMLFFLAGKHLRRHNSGTPYYT